MGNVLSGLFWVFGLGAFAAGYFSPDINMAVYFALFGVFCAITSGIVAEKA